VRAVASPIPLLAPVTSATVPWSPLLIPAMYSDAERLAGECSTVPEGVYSGAATCALTSRTSWSLCVAGTTSAEGERSAPLP
jgi:hypothetical protein